MQEEDCFHCVLFLPWHKSAGFSVSTLVLVMWLHCVPQELGELRKENFGLKLRIYHLEEALHKKNDTKDKGWQMVSVVSVRCVFVCVWVSVSIFVGASI